MCCSLRGGYCGEEADLRGEGRGGERGEGKEGFEAYCDCVCFLVLLLLLLLRKEKV